MRIDGENWEIPFYCMTDKAHKEEYGLALNYLWEALEYQTVGEDTQ
jgi:hypothetical protein